MGRKRAAGPAGLTKADLVEAVWARHGGLTKARAAEAVDRIFLTVKTSLGDGRPVKISNFGVFDLKSRAGRRGVSPGSGESIFIPAHRGLQFRASETLRKDLDAD